MPGPTREYLREQSDFDNRIPIRDPMAVTSIGQTAFPAALAREPIDPSRVRVRVNGLWYEEGTYFTLSGVTNQDLTWLDFGFTLDPQDEVFIDYFPAD